MMTFNQFRSSGAPCSNLGDALQDETLAGSEGRLYDGSLYIERWTDVRNGIAPPGGVPRWLLTVFNEQYDRTDLILLEAILYRDFYLTECAGGGDSEAMRLAFEFADRLHGEADAEEWADMLAANVANADSGVCASHDFCDANMVMHGAFVALYRRDPVPEDGPMADDDVALWNAAWSIAKRDYLTEVQG